MLSRVTSVKSAVRRSSKSLAGVENRVENRVEEENRVENLKEEENLVEEGAVVNI